MLWIVMCCLVLCVCSVDCGPNLARFARGRAGHQSNDRSRHQWNGQLKNAHRKTMNAAWDPKHLLRKNEWGNCMRRDWLFDGWIINMYCISCYFREGFSSANFASRRTNANLTPHENILTNIVREPKIGGNVNFTTREYSAEAVNRENICTRK